jgi:hypothetical protein
MRSRYFGPVMAALLLIAVSIGHLAADPLPSGIGQCSRALISWIGTRLEDGQTGQPVTNSGSAVKFANGGYQVSYDTLPQISASRVGHPVTMCLVSVPRHARRLTIAGYNTELSTCEHANRGSSPILSIAAEARETRAGEPSASPLDRYPPCASCP